MLFFVHEEANYYIVDNCKKIQILSCTIIKKYRLYNLVLNRNENIYSKKIVDDKIVFDKHKYLS